MSNKPAAQASYHLEPQALRKAGGAPELFAVLRVLVERPGADTRFLVLGSAAPALVKGASESLARRVEFVELGGFDLGETGSDALDGLWLRGGLGTRDAEAGLEATTQALRLDSSNQRWWMRPPNFNSRFWRSHDAHFRQSIRNLGLRWRTWRNCMKNPGAQRRPKPSARNLPASKPRSQTRRPPSLELKSGFCNWCGSCSAAKVTPDGNSARTVARQFVCSLSPDCPT